MLEIERSSYVDNRIELPLIYHKARAADEAVRRHTSYFVISFTARYA